MPSPTWASIPWTAAGKGWHKHRVPYVANATYLHTLDIWMPKDDDNVSSPPLAEKLPAVAGKWIVYIHGGAWCDPLVDSSSFDAAALKILATKGATKIAGIASINYPLSSQPTPPQDPLESLNIARTAKHPDHIIAVISALNYLQYELGVAHNYVLAGHSCGATLAFQVAMDAKRWANIGGNSEAIPSIKKPSILVGLNGLYDLVRFIERPDESHAAILPVYKAFTRGAFGNNEKVWKKVCPTDVEDWSQEWPEGKTVVVVQSHEDTLVPYSQTELMKKKLAEASIVEVKELNAGGGHNDLWKEGDRLAEIIMEAVAELS